MPLPQRRLRETCLATAVTFLPLAFGGLVLHSFPLPSVIFLLLGGVLFLVLPPRPGAITLLLFHALVASFWMLRYMEDGATWRLMAERAVACAVPVAMAHFGWMFFDLPMSRKARKTCVAFSYLAGGVLLAVSWGAGSETSLFVVWLVLLLLWAVGSVRVLTTPHPEFDQVFARSLLLGSVAGLAAPFGFLLAERLGGRPFSSSLTDLALPFFPVALLIGVLPKRQEERETYLVQSEKRASMGNLLSGLAHEINNPLTYIYSNMEPLQESIDHLKKAFPNPDAKTAAVLEDLEKMAHTMDVGVTRAKSLVEKFRYHPSGGSDRREGVDVNQAIGQSIDLLAPKWSGRLRLERRFEDLPKILGSPTELGQVFTNLLANACDATPDGGLVTVSTFRGASSVKVSVKDSGPGIAKSEVRKIFDPFYSTKKQGEGMGLGLAITMQIVKNHRGSIEVRSEPGKGAEFLVILPVA